MHINEKHTAVDNDFINHIAETKLTTDIIVKNLKELFNHMGIIAIIHPLVFKYEVLDGNDKVAELFKEKIIKEITFNDIFDGDTDKKSYYIYLVKELYNALLGETFPYTDEEIFTKWIRSHSLGEIHSVSMCLTCNSNLFLSDDNDSKVLKNIVKQKFMVDITVYNRTELFQEYTNSGGTNIKSNERHKMSHIRC